MESQAYDKVADRQNGELRSSFVIGLVKVEDKLKNERMPFIQQTPRMFNRQNVEALNPNQIGVYGLLKQGICIYVGKGDIRQRLLAHLNGDNPCITRETPTHWVDELTLGDPSGREKELIIEFQPSCNKKVG
jgi:hypothetical protein